MHSHTSHAHVTHMYFYGPSGVHLASRSLCMSAIASDCQWQGRTRAQRHTRGTHPPNQSAKMSSGPQLPAQPKPGIMGRSQPAALGGTCVVECLTFLGERAGLWIVRTSLGATDLRGGTCLQGPPRRIGTVKGVYLEPGGMGVRQIGLGLQAQGELGQAPARGEACLSVAMGTVALRQSRLAGAGRG